jgi:hypothetical protein
MHLCKACAAPFELIAKGNVKREFHIHPSLVSKLHVINKVAGQTHYLVDDVREVALAHYGSLKEFLKADAKAMAKREIVEAKKFEKYKLTPKYRDKLIEAALEERAGERALLYYSRKHIVWYSHACYTFSHDPTKGERELHDVTTQELRCRILKQCAFRDRWYNRGRNDFSDDITYEQLEQQVLREWCRNNPVEYYRIRDREEVFRFKEP